MIIKSATASLLSLVYYLASLSLAVKGECSENPIPLSFSRYYDYGAGTTNPGTDSDSTECPSSCREKESFFKPRCSESAYYYSVIRLKIMCVKAEALKDMRNVSCVNSLVPGPHVSAEDSLYSYRNWTVLVGKFSDYEGDNFEEYADKWMADLNSMTSIREPSVRGHAMKMEGDPGLRLVQDKAGRFPHACGSLAFGFPFSNGLQEKGFGPDRKEWHENKRYVFDLNLPRPAGCYTEPPSCAENGVIVQDVCVHDEAPFCPEDEHEKICITFLYTVPLTSKVENKSESLTPEPELPVRKRVEDRVKKLSDGKFTVKHLEKQVTSISEPDSQPRCYSMVYYYAPIAMKVMCGDYVKYRYQGPPDDKAFQCPKLIFNEHCEDGIWRAYYNCDFVLRTEFPTDTQAPNWLGVNDTAPTEDKPYMWAMQMNENPTYFHYLFNRLRKVQNPTGGQVFLKVAGGAQGQHNCGKLQVIYYDNDNRGVDTRGTGSFNPFIMRNFERVHMSNRSSFDFPLPSTNKQGTGIMGAVSVSFMIGMHREGLKERLSGTIKGKNGEDENVYEILAANATYIKVSAAYIILEVEEQKGIRLCLDSEFYDCKSGLVNETLLANYLGPYVKPIRENIMGRPCTPSDRHSSCVPVVFGEQKAHHPKSEYNRTP